MDLVRHSTAYAQRDVTGTVRLELYKGNVIAGGRGRLRLQPGRCGRVHPDQRRATEDLRGAAGAGPGVRTAPDRGPPAWAMRSSCQRRAALRSPRLLLGYLCMILDERT